MCQVGLGDPGVSNAFARCDKRKTPQAKLGTVWNKRMARRKCKVMHRQPARDSKRIMVRKAMNRDKEMRPPESPLIRKVLGQMRSDKEEMFRAWAAVACCNHQQVCPIKLNETNAIAARYTNWYHRRLVADNAIAATIISLVEKLCGSAQ